MYTQLDLGAALDAIHDPVIIAERQSLIITYTNRAFCEVTGYEPGDVYGQLLSAIYLPLDEDLPASSDQFANGTTSRRRGVLRTTGGEGVPVEARASMATMEDGQYIVCVCREMPAPTDPTDEMARWSAMEHHSFGTVPLGVFIVDSDGRITQFNYTGPAQSRFPKLNADMVEGLNLLETQFVRLNPQLHALIRQLLDGEPFERVFTRIKLPNDEFINVRIFGIPLERPGEMHPGGLLVLEDLSHHEFLARQFSVTEHRFQALLQAMPDLLLLIHKDGTYLDCKIADEMGALLPPEQFIGKKVTEIGPPDLGKTLLKSIQRVTTMGQPESLTYDLPHHGEMHTYEARLVPNLPDEVLVVVRDITARKRSEEALQRQARLLEGIAKTSIRLLNGGSYDTRLQEALSLIGEATEAQFVHLGEFWVNDETHESFIRLRNWWSIERLHTFFETHPLNITAAWNLKEYPEAYEILRQGGVIYRTVSNLGDRQRDLFAPLQIQSLVIAPIFVNGAFWGIIGFDDFETERQWRPEELTLIQAMAAGFGASIERELAAMRLHHEREIADTMVEAGTILSSTLDRNEVLARLLEQVRRIVPYDAANVMLVDEGIARVALSRGYEAFDLEDATVSTYTFDLATTPILKAMSETKEPYLCGDVWQEPRWINTPNNDLKPRCWLGIPIVVHDKMVGLFSLDSLTPNSYTDYHIRLVTPFARQAAIAYENADLYAQVQSQAAQLRIRYKEIDALYRAGQKIMTSLEPREILLHLAEQITQLTDATSTIVCTYNPVTMQGEVEAAAFRPNVSRPATDAERMTPIDFHSPALKPTITDGESQLFTGEQVEQAFPNSPWFDRVHMVIVVPLFNKGQMRGCVIVRDSRSQYANKKGDLWQCQTLTQQAASVLEQAILFAEIQDLERTKSEMIRIASHDLRGPLQRAQGFVELLDIQIHDSLTPKQSEYVRLTLEALQEVGQITREFLSLERIEQHYRVTQPVDWLQLLNDVSSSLCSELEAKQLQLSTDLPAELPIMQGDAIQLARAVSNLISNAIKYTPEEGSITLRAFISTIDERPHINIEVQDTGVGIPPEQQTALFQPFYRAKQEGTRGIPGNGLGLSIVKRAVEYHRGTVYFSSQQGRGSTFGFRLPL
jgi:PAS domain S-box-containing protein